MKTYHEMIQWVADNQTGKAVSLCYHEWPAILAIAEVYNIPSGTVFSDVQFEKDLRENALREQRKAESRASNEQRRLANLTTKGN
jgi:hypothetical protein